MIKLTRFLRNSMYIKGHGQPVWVNPAFIAALDAGTASVVRTEEHAKAPVLTRPNEPFTFVGLAFSAGEDGAGYDVQETPEEILRMLHFWRQDQIIADRDALGVRR